MAGGNFDLQTLQCWRCEPKDCHRHFDFTQHRMESCDGKCWKSFEVIETKTKEDREKAEETPALRQCFSSEDLTKASTIGLNSANGCRDVKMREKIKKFCFCDSNMCVRRVTWGSPRLGAGSNCKNEYLSESSNSMIAA
ncbi:unnamed protein product [Didymodactylos carnosus]|uniref:Uncharacterized protein n=1 Tax=Didymodactylos carnosus TaxID=1234261 RepID=A0A815QVG9_9BILA